MITGASYLQLGTLFSWRREIHMKISINFDLSEKETAAATDKAADIVDGIVKARVESFKLGLGFCGQAFEATRDVVVKAIDADLAVKNMRPIRDLKQMLHEVMDSDEGLKLGLRDSEGEVTVENPGFADERFAELTKRVHELEEENSNLRCSQVEWENNSAEDEASDQIHEALSHPDHGVKAPRKGNSRTS